MAPSREAGRCGSRLEMQCLTLLPSNKTFAECGAFRGLMASVISRPCNRTLLSSPPCSFGGSMSFEQRLQDVRDGFERPFWVANISEIFERLAYYGAFASLA